MSTSRYCCIYLATNGKWYMDLGVEEYDNKDSSVTYGPFNSQQDVHNELRFHSNPGGYFIDDRGTVEVPAVSPNGLSIQSPTKRWN